MILPFRAPVQFLLFFMLGLSSWFVVSAIFSEIPLLAQLLLEAEAVGSTLDLSVNLSNIVPLMLVLIQRKTGKSGDASIIFVSCLTNIAVSFAIIFLYPSSSSSSRSSSLQLVVVTSLAGIVGNTSMVTLFPYARAFGPAAITALSSGIGACGLVAQVLSTLQSVGHTRVAADGSSQPDPAFSLQVYFSCVCGISAISLACFVVIHKGMLVSRGQSNWAQGSLGIDQPAAGVAHLLRVEDHDPEGFAAVSEADAADGVSGNGLVEKSVERTQSQENDTSGGSIKPSVWFRSLTMSERWVCVTLSCNCFMMYALPGLLPFMCGTAENRYTVMQWLYFVYFLGSVLGRTAVSLRQFHRIVALTAGSGVAWIILMSRVFVWNNDSSIGAACVVVFCVVTCTVCNGIVSTMAFCMVASESSTKLLGLFNQAGALSGAMFAIITVRTLLV